MIADALRHLRPESPAMDAVLGLLVPDPVSIFFWHKPVKLAGQHVLFDLFDGEELGRTYRERWLAKHVTQKAAMHWRQHEEEIRAILLKRTGFERFTHISHYRRALNAITDKRSTLACALEALRVRHNDLVRHEGMEEVP